LLAQIGKIGIVLQVVIQLCHLLLVKLHPPELYTTAKDWNSMMYGRLFLIYSDSKFIWTQVFLYNFFHDSAIDASQWRVVLNGLPRESSCSAPKFDTTRHAALCPEVPSRSPLGSKVLIVCLAQIVICRHHEGPKYPVDRR
jgi:hypothetical protein